MNKPVKIHNVDIDIVFPAYKARHTIRHPIRSQAIQKALAYADNIVGAKDIKIFDYVSD